MTSARKIRANRANARASSGPKTAAGKAQSAQNAFRHGFNVPIWLDPDLASDVEALAQRIVGKSADANVLESARRVAEAQIDLRRVRSHRHRLIERAMADPKFQTEAAEPAPFEPAAARVGARRSKVPRPTTAADSSRRKCRPLWRSSPRTSRRSIAACAPRNCLWRSSRGRPRGARSLRAPRPVAAQIRHPRVRPRARRGCRRAQGRDLIRAATVSCTISSGRRFPDDEVAVSILSIDCMYCLSFWRNEAKSKECVKSITSW